MEPTESSQDKQQEGLTPEEDIVMTSIERLKLCSISEIRTAATWADVSITRDESENRTHVAPFTSDEKRFFPNTPIRLVMAGDNPDNLHFLFRINTDKFVNQQQENIDAVLIPYFSVISSFAKAAGAESFDILNNDITYADSYLAVYEQAMEMQFRYKEWVNQQVGQDDPPAILLFPNIVEERSKVRQNIYELIFGRLPEGSLRINFGIREFMLMINEQLPEMYRRRQALGHPLLDAQGLAGNPAAQQDFLSEFSMLLMLYRPPDETFEQAVIATVGQEMLAMLHDPVNLEPLKQLMNDSTHPLRTFIFVRAKLLRDAIDRAYGVYHDLDFPGGDMIRDFQEANAGPIDLAMLGAIVTGDLFLDKFYEGFRNFGFGENDRRESGS